MYLNSLLQEKREEISVSRRSTGVRNIRVFGSVARGRLPKVAPEFAY